MRSSSLALLLVCCSCLADQPFDLDGARRYRQEAIEAYRQKDYERFTVAIEESLALNPASVWTRYYTAAGYARTGRDAEAIEHLKILAKARIDYGVAEDEDFASLHGIAAFDRMLVQLEQDLRPVSNSSHRLTLDRIDLIPEGIAIDPATNRTFLSSMRSGDIFVMDANGRLSKFASVAHEGRLAAIGLCVDERRGVLWAVGSSFFAVEGFDADAPEHSGIFGFDLATGELRHRYMAEDGSVAFNDVTVGPGGDLYVSGGTLSMVPAGHDRLQPIETDPAIPGTNGIAASPDGKWLFVSSYPVGVAAVDLHTGHARFIETPAESPLYGVDGMYWHEGDLIAFQNGVEPWRLVRIALDDEFAAATSVRMIEFANEQITPTTGAIVGDVVHYVGTGPAPADPPSHIPENIRQFLGRTIVMTAPLD